MEAAIFKIKTNMSRSTLQCVSKFPYLLAHCDGKISNPDQREWGPIRLAPDLMLILWGFLLRFTPPIHHHAYTFLFLYFITRKCVLYSQRSL